MSVACFVMLEFRNAQLRVDLYAQTRSSQVPCAKVFFGHKTRQEFLLVLNMLMTVILKKNQNSFKNLKT